MDQDEIKEYLDSIGVSNEVEEVNCGKKGQFYISVIAVAWIENEGLKQKTILCKTF